MKLALKNREAIRAISPALEMELDQLMGTISQTFTREHNWEGKHTDVTANSFSLFDKNSQQPTPGATQYTNPLPQDSGQHWLSGPWLLDDVHGGTNKAVLHPPDGDGTYDDYEPAGIENCVVIELEPDTQITLTGINQPKRYRRLLIIGNRDSGSGILTLTNQDTGSLERNRFRLPANEDVDLIGGEYAWFYYDIEGNRWRMIVTGQESGGIGESTGVGGVSDMLVATLTLSASQIDNINATPITIVPAAGANTMIAPVYWAIHTVKVGTTPWSASPFMTLIHEGNNTAINGNNLSMNLNTAGSVDLVAQGQGYTTNSLNYLSFDRRNKALQVRASSDAVQGAGSDGTAKVVVVYYIMQTQ